MCAYLGATKGLPLNPETVHVNPWCCKDWAPALLLPFAAPFGVCLHTVFELLENT